MEILKNALVFISVSFALFACDKGGRRDNCEYGAKLFREVECLQI